MYKATTKPNSEVPIVTFDPTHVEVEKLREAVRRMFGVRPRKLTDEERAALKKASNDPEEMKRKFRMVDGRLVEVE